MASEDREQPKDDTSADEDREADRDATDADLDWVVAVDIECLGWPMAEGLARTRKTLNGWCTNQNMMIEKKFAPEMNVMTRVKLRMRGSCLSRLGNIGCAA